MWCMENEHEFIRTGEIDGGEEKPKMASRRVDVFYCRICGMKAVVR